MRKPWLILCAIILLQTAVIAAFGQMKSGFHEDELYTYFSSNRSAGIRFADGEELSGRNFLDELTVREGERFRYGMVRTVQSWDVHPPLYYCLFHTVCSLTPGVFSRWQGIAVNIAGFVLSQLILGCLAFRVFRDRFFSAAVPAVWGFTAAAVSAAMFIRMYVWLTFWVLAMLLAHAVYLERIREDLRDRSSGRREPGRYRAGSSGMPLMYLLFAVISFCGFLTQYYYLIALFFAGLYTAVFLIMRIRKGLPAGHLALYCASHAAAGILGLLYYPSAAAQIFRGYRGKEAQASFFDLSNTVQRLKLFFSLTDRYAFGGILLPLLGAVLLGYAAVKLAERRKPEKSGGVPDAGNDGGSGTSSALQAGLLAVTAAGYFTAVAKTGLLLGETSLRYELPVCPVLVLLVLLLYRNAEKSRRAGRIAAAAAGSLIVVLNAAHLSEKDVLFLYPENAARTEFAEEHADVPAAVLYNDQTPDHIWWIADRLVSYDRIVLFEESTDPDEDMERLCSLMEGEDEVVVYAAGKEGYPADRVFGSGGAVPLEEDRMWKTWLIKVRKP